MENHEYKPFFESKWPQLPPRIQTLKPELKDRICRGLYNYDKTIEIVDTLLELAETATEKQCKAIRNAIGSYLREKSV